MTVGLATSGRELSFPTSQTSPEAPERSAITRSTSLVDFYWATSNT
jgi:hypothetical protein